MAENRLFDNSLSSYESAPSELLPPQLQADYLYPQATGHQQPPSSAAYQPVSSYQPVQADFNKRPTELHQPDFDVPPYYSGQAPPSQQPPEAKVLLVQQQPIANSTLLTIKRPVGDHCLIFSIVMSVVAVFCFCVTIPTLLCTIPALIFSILARDDDRNGDLTAARTKGRISLGLNLTALVVMVLFWTAYIVAAIVVNSL